MKDRVREIIITPDALGKWSVRVDGLHMEEGIVECTVPDVLDFLNEVLDPEYELPFCDHCRNQVKG